jgi:hypothetical protein
MHGAWTLLHHGYIFNLKIRCGVEKFGLQTSWSWNWGLFPELLFECTTVLGCAFLKESSGIPLEFREWAFEIAGTWFLLPQEPTKKPDRPQRNLQKLVPF